jgi:FAD/FMN-containing dehydrogenase
VRRRDFLALGGLAAVFAGCSRVASPPSSTARREHLATSTTTTPSSEPSTTIPATRADWRAFGRRLSGELVLPGSPSYRLAAESYNPVFDNKTPQGICYVASSGDVTEAIAFAKAHGVATSVRSGGHCYGGWSTGGGLVIDVSRLNHTRVDRAHAVVGSGTRLVDLYAACAAHGVSVPGGSCPTVGIAGLALGGGLGVLDRKFGLTCDNLTSAEVVLSSGEVLRCDEQHYSDLFWALRGAGGGSYGVVTELTFGTHPIGDLAIFTLVFEWKAASAVVAAWQDWAPQAVDELWSNCLLLAGQSTPDGSGLAARVTGVYVGAQSALESEIESFLSSTRLQPFDRFVGTAGYLQTMLIEAGCDNMTLAECHLPSENSAGQLQRAPFAARSDIVTQALDKNGVRAVLAAVEARLSGPLSGGGIALDAAGGAINRVASDATAFVHRDALFTLQYSANWQEGASAGVIGANRDWLRASWQSLRPYVSGQAYQNYADPALRDWARAYYGSNLPRLQQIKARYDPGDFFSFPQSIPLPS